MKRAEHSAPQNHKTTRSKVEVLLALLVSLVACGDDLATPSGTAVATFSVAGETFRVRLVDDRQIESARAAQAGGPARIPNGRIVAGSEVNQGWTWHLEDLEFVASTIELCDGRPSDVEGQGVGFGGGRFCPWTARVVSVDSAN